MEALKEPEDFYKFFKEIPEERWITDEFKEEWGCCALGHLGFDGATSCDPHHPLNRAANRLQDFIGSDAPRVNDGNDPRYQQATPRHRIISALQDAIDKKTNNQRIG